MYAFDLLGLGHDAVYVGETTKSVGARYRQHRDFRLAAVLDVRRRPEARERRAAPMSSVFASRTNGTMRDP